MALAMEAWSEQPEKSPRALTARDVVRCDLAAVGLVWTGTGFGAIGRVLESKRSQGQARWTFTTTELTVEGSEAGDAVAMARSVVWLARARGE